MHPHHQSRLQERLERDHLVDAPAETPLPRPASQNVVRFLRLAYGLDASVRRLPGENHNYAVTTTGGGRCVLKIAAHGQSPADLDLEHAAIEHLADACFGLDLPRSVATSDGSPIAHYPSANSDADGDAGVQATAPARLTAFIDGEPWPEQTAPLKLLRALGRQLASLETALDGFEHPAARRTHRWDLTRALRLESLAELADSESRRQLLDDAWHLTRAHLVPRLAELPTAFIHGDLNGENLLVAGGKLVGLLDFGDALVNPRVCELAIALAYALQRQHDPLAAASAVVAGYESEHLLSPVERYVLLPLVCTRLAASLSIAAERRSQGTDGTDHFVTEGPAWKLLEQLLALGDELARLGGRG